MAKKKLAGSIGTPATVALRAAGVAYIAHAYAHNPSSPSYGKEAAQVLGVDPRRVFKTLMIDVDGALMVAIVPVIGTLDLKAVAQATGHKKATMADAALAQRRTGYVLGGISPLGQRNRSPTVLDESACLFDTIYVSGGHRGFDVELAPTDLIAMTQATTAKIAHLGQ